MRLIRRCTAAAVLILIAGVMCAQAPVSPGEGQIFRETLPQQSDNYPLGPDSLPHADVPAGKTFSFELSNSKVFPGTTRTINVYVPAQYTGQTAACLYVGLDGLGFRASTVFDNLIAKKQMPVTIGVGIAPGTVASSSAPQNPRFDRSLEFDMRSARLARFIEEEVLPAVEQHQAPGGPAIRLSKDPNDRAIGGASTGGIGAFNVAWERPDLFRRVFMSIGTFVGMRGGEQYYVLVRKTEPKPIRIFMQDNVYDQWPGGLEMGDWWMSNRTMERALTFAGYDVNHIWGTGGHSSNQATAIFPDGMRWLWQDWPNPIVARPPGNRVLQDILQPTQGWHVAAEHCGPGLHLAADPHGMVFYAVQGKPELAAIGMRSSTDECQQPADSSLAFGPDRTVYIARPAGGIMVAPSAAALGKAKLIAPDLLVRDLTVRNDGAIYATATSQQQTGELWLLPRDRAPVRLDGSLKGPAGVALTPDGLWLVALEMNSHDALSYRVGRDGTTDAREPLYDFYVPAGADNSGAASLAMDRDGRAYVATSAGVQVMDRNGRVTAILPLPDDQPATSLCFGGPSFDQLYVAAGDKVFWRTLRVQGAPPWAAPIQLPVWGPG